MTLPSEGSPATPGSQTTAEPGTSPQPTGDTSTSTPSSPIPAVSRAQGEEEAYSKALDLTRQRSDLTAKAIAGLGSSAIGALGIAKLTDIWPPGEPTIAVLGLCAGFLLMAVGVVMLARGVWSAQQPVVLGSGGSIDDLEQREQLLVNRISDEIAHFHDVESLRAYEARGERLNRIATRLRPSDSELADRLVEDSQVIAAKVSATRMRAVYAVVRQRATRAFYSGWSVSFAFLIAVGFYLVGISADKLDAERSGQIDFAKSCAVAIGTPNIDTNDLPPACSNGAPNPPQPNAPPSDTGTTSTTSSTTTTSPSSPNTTTKGGP